MRFDMFQAFHCLYVFHIQFDYMKRRHQQSSIEFRLNEELTENYSSSGILCYIGHRVFDASD